MEAVVHKAVGTQCEAIGVALQNERNVKRGKKYGELIQNGRHRFHLIQVTDPQIKCV